MLKLDHLTVIAPTLVEGVAHVRACLDIDVPFGTRHTYMGTHNHRLLLGNSVYLEIIALDPTGTRPANGRARWFGLDNQVQVRADWEEGRRLRGWVANTLNLDAVLATHGAIFGDALALPNNEPTFSFSVPKAGALPLDGAMPSLIDHRGDDSHVLLIPDFGARLQSLIQEHPEPISVQALYHQLAVDRPPDVQYGPKLKYRALIETPAGTRELT